VKEKPMNQRLKTLALGLSLTAAGPAAAEVTRAVMLVNNSHMS
jgi:hypothetical protein